MAQDPEQIAAMLELLGGKGQQAPVQEMSPGLVDLIHQETFAPQQQGALPDNFAAASDNAFTDLVSQMQYEKAVKDRDEVTAGTRFFDTGTKIPGVQKGRNDAYMSKIK